MWCHKVTELKLGLLMRCFRSSVFCGKEDLLSVFVHFDLLDYKIFYLLKRWRKGNNMVFSTENRPTCYRPWYDNIPLSISYVICIPNVIFCRDIQHHMIKISIVLQVFTTLFIIPWTIVGYVIQFKYSVIFPGCFWLDKYVS